MPNNNMSRPDREKQGQPSRKDAQRKPDQRSEQDKNSSSSGRSDNR